MSTQPEIALPSMQPQPDPLLTALSQMLARFDIH